MLIHPMVERLRELGLSAMADAFTELRNQSAADDLSREDWLGLLIDREVTARDNKRLGRRLNVARLRQNAVIEDADLRTPRGLDRGLFQTLTGCGLSMPVEISPEAPVENSPLRCLIRLEDGCHGARSRQGTRARARAASGFIP
jgi:hypothetical protein